MDTLNNITSSSDLIKYLQPILLQATPQQSASLFDSTGHEHSAGGNASDVILNEEYTDDEDVTNLQLLQESNSLENGKIPIQINVILEYILTYMEKQSPKHDFQEDCSNSYALISELEKTPNSTSKLQDLLVIMANFIKGQTKQMEVYSNVCSTSPPSTRHSNLVLMDNIVGSGANSRDFSVGNGTAIEELISLIVSECVKNNIVLEATKVSSNAGYNLLDSSIKELVQLVADLKSKNINSAAESPSLERSATRDSSAELALKLQDLQLAHDFLSEKFSKERLYYNNEITAKEKQMLSYKKEAQSMSNEIKNLREKMEQLKVGAEETKVVTPYFENEENTALLNSPVSIASNSSESINVLKTEFKNQLNKIRNYYEAELEKLGK